MVESVCGAFDRTNATTIKLPELLKCLSRIEPIEIQSTKDGLFICIGDTFIPFETIEEIVSKYESKRIQQLQDIDETTMKRGFEILKWIVDTPKRVESARARLSAGLEVRSSASLLLCAA